ncbi:MAG: DUF4397 domain-containing protein [Lachnospiraceae bacterium]|nr:DUF4397 domain-containing protein [Lachnospiraceae bacterium]
MDYSKTHYYKYTTPTTPRQVRSNVPVFETDDTPAAPGMGPAGSATPDLESNIPGNGNQNGGIVGGPVTDVPAAPGEGPVGTPTPSLPSNPSGSITIPFPPASGSGNSGSSGTSSGSNILWSYVWSTPLFQSLSSVAQARFYNVNSMMEPVDIYINGQLVVSDLDYSEYTDYLYIIPGYYTITIYRRTNPGFPILNTRVNFVRNSTCMVSLIGTVDSAGLQFIC